jgi:diacylglycerol kinase family enzyme
VARVARSSSAALEARTLRALLVYNPSATTTNGGVLRAITASLSAELKLDVESTQYRDHAGTLAAAAVREGYDVLVALGGDGTLNEVVQSLALTPVKLALLPGGSANVFARTLGLGSDPVAATQALLHRLREGQERTVNLGTANDRLFTFCAGWGYDAEVVRMVDERPRRKRTMRQATFLWCGALAQLAGRAAWRGVTLTTGGDPPLGGLSNVICCNTDPYTYLGPLPGRLCPAARLEGGLDVTALTRARLADLVRLATAALTSDRVPALPYVRTWHDRSRYALTSDRPLPLQVDGEFVGHTDELVLRAVPRALTVIA